jgi:hypothetical protein
MRKFIYLIGSTDDFESLEELKEYYFNADLQRVRAADVLNASIFEFDLPMNCSNEIAVRVGRGLAFENGWCMDDTLSDLLEA